MIHWLEASACRLIVVYSDFRSPWGYLASRRLERLSAAGLGVDWRAVTQAEPPNPSQGDSGDLSRVHAEMEAVVGALLPEETLPFALAGFVPGTTAAVAAYAESYRMGMSNRVRPLLFEALWLHGFDLGDASEVHTLLTDAWRQGPCPEDRRGVGGVPADDLIGQWRAEHAALGPGTVTVVRGPAAVLVDAQAVAWLGELLQQTATTV
jgi:DSBA-like thioredoxin domain